MTDAPGDFLEATVVALTAETPKISDAAKNLLSEQVALSQVQDKKFDTAELLGAVQTLLKALKTLELQDPVAWGQENPQLESESGMQRIEAIARYKAVYVLWKKIKSQNESPSKLLGKTYLNGVWSQLSKHVAGTAKGTEVLTFVMKLFEESLNSTNEVPNLIWKLSLHEAVKIRHGERKEKAAERLKEFESPGDNDVGFAADGAPADSNVA